MVRPLAEAAVRLAPSFNAQGAANSLWAVATLGLDERRIVRPLAEAAVRLAPSFHAQGAANSLWAAASLELPSVVVDTLASAAARNAGDFKLESAVQVLEAHFAGAQVHTTCLDACWRIFRASSRPSRTSELQKSVAASLHAMGYAVAQEVPILEGLRCIDIVATAPNGARIAVEVDGLSHYFARLLGGGAPRPRPSRLRDRHAAAAGYAVRATVSYLEWDACTGGAERQRLLGEILQGALEKVR
jgi:hypothetical protein